LAARELHEAALHHVEHRRAREPAQHRGAADGERERRQRQVPEVLEQALAERHPAAGGKEPDAQREAEDQHDAEPEIGDGHAEQAHGQRRAVGEAAPARAAQHAERDAEQRGAQRGEQRELERDGEAVEDHATDRLVLAEVDAEVAAHGAGQPADVLRGQRLVEVEGLAQRADALRRGLVAQHGHGGVAGTSRMRPKIQHAHAEQQRHRQQEPAGRVDHQEIQVSSNFSSSDGYGTEPARSASSSTSGSRC
jgi:SWI/SNF-related matrix-associated actin-dependent regulator 1 of chromatin subfamily A